ncbi:energy transducer TonB family protein [Geopsychrobacter electrodiphilus]|uniref:energy transducer TonB family protein n=1 Tax=Geopsychrobacter electrodiphilus TaxID=225196 RepID=UPI00039A5DE0|nr:energy transducer TonB [Geopsychrobacter electrodiphilus]
MNIEELSPHRTQPLEHPWGRAFCYSLLIHAGVIIALALHVSMPVPPMNLPKAIKVDLISIPAVPKVRQKSLPRAVIQKPVLPQPIIRPRPIIQQKTEQLPQPAVSLKQNPETIPRQITPPKLEFKRPATDKIEQSPPINPLLTSTKDIPVLSPAEAPIDSPLTPMTSAQSDSLQSYSNLIRQRIDRVKRYPLMARKAGKQGKVMVEFSVDRQGKLLESRILTGCGTKVLDDAALKALTRASPFPQLPDDLPSPHKFSIQINFFLGS